MESIKFELLGRDALLEVSELSAFIECDEFNKFAFGNHSKSVTLQEFDPNIHKSIILKFKLSEKNRSQAFFDLSRSQSNFNDAVHEYEVKYFGIGNAKEIETVICNHFELQKKYYLQ